MMDPTADRAGSNRADQPQTHGPDEETTQTWGDMADEEEQQAAAPLDQEALEASLRGVQRGQIVNGAVVEVRADEGVVVHVGGKYEGVIPRTEFTSEAELPKEGDTVSVAILRVNDEDGHVVLSKKKADYENVWRKITAALETGEVLTAMVTERVKGGLRVDLGVHGFVPASHVGTRNVRDLDRFVGRSLRLKVLEADRRQKKVILSHRLVLEEERKRRREETLARLEEGVVCEGKVRNVTEYGAFVDLGGVDGLLHISEMSWTRIKHPSEVLSVGDTIQVEVLGVDRQRGRISLGRRSILPDPWNQAAQSIKVGSLVKATITRIVRNGVFARVDDLGIEGFCPISELAERRVSDPAEVVKVGQGVDLKVLNFRPEERRMTLSLAEAQQERERQEYRDYMRGQTQQRRTLGDQFGDILQGVAVRPEEAHLGPEAAAAEQEAAAEVSTPVPTEAPEPQAGMETASATAQEASAEAPAFPAGQEATADQAKAEPAEDAPQETDQGAETSS